MVYATGIRPLTERKRGKPTPAEIINLSKTKTGREHPVFNV
jgi:hypothetical protein